MNRLGIESISVFGLPPVECVNLASLLSQALAGESPQRRLGRCVEAARNLLTQLE